MATGIVALLDSFELLLQPLTRIVASYTDLEPYEHIACFLAMQRDARVMITIMGVVDEHDESLIINYCGVDTRTWSTRSMQERLEVVGYLQYCVRIKMPYKKEVSLYLDYAGLEDLMINSLRFRPPQDKNQKYWGEFWEALKAGDPDDLGKKMYDLWAPRADAHIKARAQVMSDDS